MPQAQPELKKVTDDMPRVRLPRNGNSSLVQYLDKRLFVQLNGSRKVIGVLRGYDVSFPLAALWCSSCFCVGLVPCVEKNTS